MANFVWGFQVYGSHLYSGNPPSLHPAKKLPFVTPAFMHSRTQAPAPPQALPGAAATTPTRR